MKVKRHIVLAASMAVFLGVARLPAQTNVAIDGSPSPSPSPSTPTSTSTTDPTLTDRDADTDSRLLSTEEVERLIKEESSFRPSVEQTRISPEVRRKLQQFVILRERYLKEQERLLKEFKGATEKERDILRERIRLRRLEWLERSRNIREDTRDRLRPLLRELSPKYQEALEAARENARDKTREGLNEIRKERPGQD